jgi:hypothetical protein
MDLGEAAFKGEKPIDVKVNVKPVFVFLAHHNAAEGPCRTGTPEQLDPAAERRHAQEAYASFSDQLKIQSPAARVLDPVFIEHGDDWLVRAEEYQKLDRDVDEVDLYLVSGRSLNQFFAVKLGEHYRKPVAMVGVELDGLVPMGCDMASHLRAKGLEAYVSLGWGEFDELLSLMQARKAMRRTRVLRVTQGQFDNVNGSFLDPSHFQRYLGLEAVDVPIKAYAAEWDRVRQDRDAWRLAEQTARALVQQAQDARIETHYVANDVVSYLAAKSLMEAYGCNAFTIDCFEICPDGRVAADRETVPCLTHTLFKDQGIPSSCEGDICVLSAIGLVQSLAKKTAYMGNLFLVSREDHLIKILHDVPGLKLKGYDAPDVPYELQNFTLGGWGTTVRYDFCQDKGQQVTIARVNPSADKLMVTRGTIAGCAGMNSPSCSLQVIIEVADPVDFFHKAVDFGNHSAMVYGDYAPQLRALAGLMHMGVTEA